MANAIFDVEGTLAKLTLPQKIKMLAGLVCPIPPSIRLGIPIEPFTMIRAGGILNLFQRQVFRLCV